MRKCLFTVDLEAWYHALYRPVEWPAVADDSVCDTTRLLLQVLADARVRGQWYVLGDVAKRYPALVADLRRQGHGVGSHGYWHRVGEREGDDSDRLARRFIGDPCHGYRSPYWATTRRPGLGGGVFFRLLPVAALQAEVSRSGVFYLHPHDLAPRPLGRGPLRLGPLAVRRAVWAWGRPQDKLWRLLKELTWADPSASS